MNIEFILEQMNRIGRLENALVKPSRPDYHYKDHKIEYGRDLTNEEMIRLLDAEVFICLDKNNEPFTLLMMDVYGTLREKLLPGANRIEI